jgi:Cd2+/Zn2+-exporting ATPase
LVVSIPLSFFGGIGGASRQGILVKGSNYLEALAHLDQVVFDKTGTLTHGKFQVTQVVPAPHFTTEELLRIAAHVESQSNHPIAMSILKAYGKDVDPSKITAYEEIAGYGIRATLEEGEVLAGNHRFMVKESINMDDVKVLGTVVHLSVNGQYAGHLVIADEVKKDSAEAITKLKALGIRKTVMLTGDRRSVGEKVGELLGLDEIHTELLPGDKVKALEELMEKSTADTPVAFVGDGINDAPVLARAHVGIAMGGLGSDAAIEAADVVIMSDEPLKVATAVKIARRTRRIVWQNIAFALGVKGLFLLLGALGFATMWEAVFADVGVTVLAVLNAMRAMNTKGL